MDDNHSGDKTAESGAAQIGSQRFESPLAAADTGPPDVTLFSDANQMSQANPVLAAPSSNPYLAPGPESSVEASSSPPRELSGLEWLLFSFEGRISRSVFWMAKLGSSIGVGAVLGLFMFLSDLFGLHRYYLLDTVAEFLSVPVAIMLYLTMIWISLAISVKRWHDRGKSGWWMLIGMIPVLGALWAIVETGFLPGTDGPNRYGENPLG